MGGIESELAAQQSIQDMIACHASMRTILLSICEFVEWQMPGASCSIMLFNEASGKTNVIGPCVPAQLQESVERLPLFSRHGQHGALDIFKAPFIISDITVDPVWPEFADILSAEGFTSCWSSPITSSADELMGAFVTTYRTAKAPQEQDQERLQRAVGLAALALARHRDRQNLRTAEQRYRSLFFYHPDPIFEFDLNGLFLSANPAVSTLTGFTERELIGKHYREIVVDKDLPATDRAFGKACRGEPQSYELLVKNSEGNQLHLEVINLPIMTSGEVVGVFGIARDVTMQKKYEEDLRLLMRGIEASINGVVMADARAEDMPLVYTNTPFLRISGYSKEEVLGRNPRFLQGPATDPEARQQIRIALAEEKEVQVTMRNYRKDGTPFWNHLYIAPVRDNNGQCTHFVGIMHDVTQHKAFEEQLAHQATHDMLTGLLNRQQFQLRLQHDYKLCQQSRTLLAVLFIDLDGFKQINDGVGPSVADQLLIAAAQRLTELTTPGDTLARFGSDEFGVLLPRAANRDEIQARAEEVLQTLTQPFEMGAHFLHITASIGIASNHEPIGQPYELIQHADWAKQQAKQQGRNTWQWYNPETTTFSEEHIALRRELNEAIQNDQFEIHYQPIMCSQSGQARSMEALIRWNHPQRGQVPPVEFIPFAEQTGQIIAIGRWVLRKACEDMASLETDGNASLSVAVNISPLQFRRDGFLEEVRLILAETGLSPRRLELELTESVLMSGTERAIRILNELSAMGVKVAIDDFGTGYSSLRYLRQLPVQKVKLDRCFIQDITHNSGNAAIVQGVITMAHHLKLTVVAEGIETTEQQQDLIDRQCDLLQGFLFARPMPFDSLKAFIKAAHNAGE